MIIHFYSYRPDWTLLTNTIDQDRFYAIMAYQNIESVEFFIGDTNIAYVRVKKTMGTIGTFRSHYSLWANEALRVMIRLRGQIQEAVTAEGNMHYHMALATSRAAPPEQLENVNWAQEGF